MISRRAPWAAALAALLTVPVLASPVLASPARADDPDPVAPSTSATPQDVAQDVAQDALERVEDIADPAQPSSPAQTAGDGKDLTLALRDLLLTREDLPRSQQDDAARLLARPTDGATDGCDPYACYRVAEQPVICGTRICVHHVGSTDDAATLTYAQRALDRVESVATAYVAAGYRTPVSDGATGGDLDKVDVYLADLGPLGLYGYCTSDEDVSGHVTAAAYCVLDNDYSADDFGTSSTPTENLEVTAAHEYFHAVQFAYDLGESTWFMESTATWAEDELYDSVNDNRAYLPFGPLGKPAQPLGTSSNLNVYGAWIFIRYLSENFPADQGGMPKIVADLWLKAANSGPGAGAMSSIDAIRSALTERGTTYEAQFARFAVWNRRPGTFYSEGSAYRPAPLYKSWVLSPSRTAASVRFTAHRNAARHVHFTRGSFAGTRKLKVRLDLNTPASGAVAYVVVKPTSGAARSKQILLNSSGDAAPTYWFGPKTAWIEISLVNAGQTDRAQAVSAQVSR